jgi:hypothetical protein
MTLTKYFFAGATLVLLSLAGSGCQTHKTTAPEGGGYEVVSHPHHALLDDPEPPRLSLQRRGPDDTLTQIWPSLYSEHMVIQGDLALFVADKAFIQPERTTHPRLFAVKTPDLPLDLTDEILWRWSKANNKDFAKTLEKFAEIQPAQNGGGVEVRLQFWSNPAYGSERDDWPDEGSLQLDWRQIDDLMRAVKTKGVLQKDLRWHTPYIGEKY